MLKKIFVISTSIESIFNILKKERRLHMEIEILSMLQKIRTPLLDIFMSNITKLGNAGIVWILLTIVLLLIPKTEKVG